MKVPLNTRAVKFCRNFILSSGAIAGTAYCYQQAGVWGTPEETSTLCDKIKVRIEPKLKEHFPDEMFKVPSINNISEGLRDLFNNGVKKSFSFMQMMPTHAQNMGVFLVKACNEKRLQLIEIYKAKMESIEQETSKAREDTFEKQNQINAIREDNFGINHENDSKVLQIDEDDEEKREANKQDLLALSTCL